MKIHSLLIKETIDKSFINKFGCYILRTTQFPSGIPRMIISDPMSILYIGKANNLKNRILSLQKSILNNSIPSQINPIEKGHKALSRKFFRIRRHIEIEQLLIDFFLFENADPEAVETIFLELYVSKFGELPPLNGQFGKYTLKGALEETQNIRYELTTFIKYLDLPIPY